MWIVITTILATIWIIGIIVQALIYIFALQILAFLLKSLGRGDAITATYIQESWSKIPWMIRDAVDMVFWPIVLAIEVLKKTTKKKGKN